MDRSRLHWFIYYVEKKIANHRGNGFVYFQIF